MKHDFTTDPTHEKATNMVLHSLEETKHMKWASSQSPRFLAKGMLETAPREMQPKQGVAVSLSSEFKNAKGWQ